MIWVNGILLPQDQARIDPMDRGFTLGDGLFETMRVAGGEIRWLARHWARLCRGAAIIDLTIPYRVAEIAAAIDRLMAVQPDPLNGTVRLTLTRGVGARGILPPLQPSPTLILAVSPFIPQDQPVEAIVVTKTRRNEFSLLSQIKTTSYLESILARQEAVARGGDEAILLNSVGTVAEAAVGNLFFMIEGRLVTPRVEDGALPGIARGIVLEQIGGVEASIGPAAMFQADYGFITNALGVRAIKSINFRQTKKKFIDDVVLYDKITKIFA